MDDLLQSLTSLGPGSHSPTQVDPNVSPTNGAAFGATFFAAGPQGETALPSQGGTEFPFAQIDEDVDGPQFADAPLTSSTGLIPEGGEGEEFGHARPDRSLAPFIKPDVPAEALDGPPQTFPATTADIAFNAKIAEAEPPTIGNHFGAVGNLPAPERFAGKERTAATVPHTSAVARQSTPGLPPASIATTPEEPETPNALEPFSQSENDPNRRFSTVQLDRHSPVRNPENSPFLNPTVRVEQKAAEHLPLTRLAANQREQTQSATPAPPVRQRAFQMSPQLVEPSAEARSSTVYERPPSTVGAVEGAATSRSSWPNGRLGINLNSPIITSDASSSVQQANTPQTTLESPVTNTSGNTPVVAMFSPTPDVGRGERHNLPTPVKPIEARDATTLVTRPIVSQAPAVDVPSHTPTTSGSPMLLAPTQSAQPAQLMATPIGKIRSQSPIVETFQSPRNDAPSGRDAPPLRAGGWTVSEGFSSTPPTASPTAHTSTSFAMPLTVAETSGGVTDTQLSFDLLFHAGLLSTSSGLLGPNASPFTQPASATAQVIAQQLSSALASASNTQDVPLELALDPPELGRVRMQMVDQLGIMTLTIHAERPETADLMRRHMDLLAKEFSEAGLDAPTVHISRDGQTDQGHPDREDEQVSTAPTSEDAVPDLPLPTTSHAATGGLDLRL